MSAKVLTRREFLKTSASAAVAGAMFLRAPDRLLAGEEEKKSRVVLVRDKDVLDGNGQPDPKVLSRMLDEAISKLVGEDDPKKAWKEITQPDDIVGIKSNKWPHLHTPSSLEEAIELRLLESGVDPDNISIDDQGIRGNPVFRNSTALINVRPLRTHHWSGVGSLIKNYIMFVDRPSAYHPDSCADLAKIWKLEHVTGKTRLNVLVALTPLFHGIGPHHYNAEYVWAYRGLLVGFDPVAVDAMGVRLLQAKRAEFFQEERPLNPPPKHVFLADTRHHLGTADPAKIDLVRIGWEEAALI